MESMVLRYALALLLSFDCRTTRWARNVDVMLVFGKKDKAMGAELVTSEFPYRRTDENGEISSMFVGQVNPCREAINSYKISFIFSMFIFNAHLLWLCPTIAKIAAAGLGATCGALAIFSSRTTRLWLIPSLLYNVIVNVKICPTLLLLFRTLTKDSDNMRGGEIQYVLGSLNLTVYLFLFMVTFVPLITMPVAMFYERSIDENMLEGDQQLQLMHRILAYIGIFVFFVVVAIFWLFGWSVINHYFFLLFGKSLLIDLNLC